MARRRISRSARAKTLYPYKSKLEVRTQELLPDAPYEKTKLAYVKQCNYTPDFEIGPNVFLEAKGLFKSDDRTKHLLIKKAHPEVTVYFLFERPYNKLSKASKTTYADWCEKYGYEWTTIEQGIPEHWLATTKTKKAKRANHKDD